MEGSLKRLKVVSDRYHCADHVYRGVLERGRFKMKLRIIAVRQLWQSMQTREQVFQSRTIRSHAFDDGVERGGIGFRVFRNRQRGRQPVGLIHDLDNFDRTGRVRILDALRGRYRGQRSGQERNGEKQYAYHVAARKVSLVLFLMRGCPRQRVP